MSNENSTATTPLRRTVKYIALDVSFTVREELSTMTKVKNVDASWAGSETSAVVEVTFRRDDSVIRGESSAEIEMEYDGTDIVITNEADMEVRVSADDNTSATGAAVGLLMQEALTYAV